MENDFVTDDFIIWDEKTERLILNPDQDLLREFPAVATLCRRAYKGSREDEKPLAALIYYYFFLDPASPADGLANTERREIALKMSGLPSSFSPTRKQKDAFEELKAFRLKTQPSRGALATSKRALNKISGTMDVLLNQMDTAQTQAEGILSSLTTTGAIDVDQAQALQVLNDSLIGNVGRVMRFIQDLPKAHQALEELQKLVKKERADIAQKRGKTKKGRREDPNNF